MNLLCVVKRPLTSRDAERFGILRAMERGHAVTVFDVSRPSHPELSSAQDLSWAPPALTVESFESWKALRKRVQAFRDADAVFLFNQSFGIAANLMPVLRLVAATRKPYLIMGPALYGATMPRLDEVPPGAFLGEAMKRLRLMNPLNSIVARIPRAWLGIPPARFVVYNGLASIRPNNLVGPETGIIPAHTSDYDQFLRLAAKRHPQENIAVFLDQYVPFHPDLKAAKTATTIDPDAYFAALRELFDRVEAELQSEVVVAAHPRADYRDRPHLLGNRRIVYGQSAELIARSRIVLSHISTALGLAVLCNKPVMLVATRDFYRLTPGHTFAFDQAARTLGTPLRFIDDPETIDVTGGMSIDAQAYAAYVGRYIRHPDAPDGFLWDIVLDRVERALA